MSLSQNTRRVAVAPAVENLEDRRLFDGTLGSAQDLGTIFGVVTRNGTVSSGDVIDYYKVKLNSTGKIFARLTNLTANADLRLIKDSNNNGVAEASEVIGTSLNGGTTSEQIIKAPLAPGWYFLQVRRVAGSPSYKLTVKPDYAGQDFGSSRNLGTFTSTKTFQDRVDGDDFVDMYKIVLTSTKTVSASMTGTGDAHLELAKDMDNDGVYDNGQDFIHRSNKPNTSNENLGSFTLNAGTYYIRVFRGAADAQYNLSIKIV